MKRVPPAGSEKKCGACKETLAIGLFYKHRGRPDGYDWACKACTLASRDRVKHAAYNKAYHAANRERVNAKTRECNRRRRALYPEKHRAQKNRWYRELREKILVKHGGACAFCGFDDRRCLQIDHVHGGGTVERERIAGAELLRKVLKDTTGSYQLLCANCNWLKRWESDEEQPRKRVRLQKPAA